VGSGKDDHESGNCVGEEHDLNGKNPC